MDAKEFLSQATVLNEKINMDFLHLQKLKKMRKRFENLEFPMFREHVQGGELPSSPESKLIDQIMDLEREILDELAEYEVVLAQIKEAIAVCGDYREMQILQRHYLEGKSIADFCEEKDYSRSYAYKLHDTALKKIETYLLLKSRQ